MSGIDFLLDLNRRNAEAFCAPTTTLERELHLSKHPTRILFIKCMDGRLHGPVITETPPGLITPMRNGGGRFRLGWPAFKQFAINFRLYATSQKAPALVVTTYHYSRGDTHRGCAAFEYDTAAARASSSRLKKEFDEVFGQGNALYTIQCGVETDLDALILHGENDEVVDLSEITDTSHSNLLRILGRLYPNMPKQIMTDFMPLVTGNIAHIAKIRTSGRPITDIVHKEWVLAVGRGLDWFHEINMALIVGIFDPELHRPIQTAGRVIKSNLDEGRINGQKPVLLTSAIYRKDVGEDMPAAKVKARWLMEFALDKLREHSETRELVPRLNLLTTIVNGDTRRMEVLARYDVTT